MLKKKILLIMAASMLVWLIPFCWADFIPNEVNVYVWADKIQYEPGDTVTLHYCVVNAKSLDIVLKEIRINTPWFMYIKDHWEGNQTIKITWPITPGNTYYGYTTLTIPDDGRAFFPGSSAEINIRFDFDGATDKNVELFIGIANPPIHSTVRDMDTLILLMAVQIILMVICTSLIAAAIFLSARKPQEPYQETSKSGKA